MKTSYKVREHFYLHKGQSVYSGGEMVELTEEESQLYRHMIEPSPVKKVAKPKGGEG